MRRTTLPATALLLLTTLPAAAGEEGWVGRKVITKFGTVLRVGKQVVDDEGRGHALAHGYDARRLGLYRVERANGPWLWLVDERYDIEGWAKADRVVAYETALEYLTAEVKAHPESAAARIDRGYFLFELKETDRAISDFTGAIRLQPANAYAFNGRANAWYAKADDARAIDDYDAATRLDPAFTRARVNRAYLLGASGDEERSLAEFDAVLSQTPEPIDRTCKSDALIGRAGLRHELGRWDEVAPDVDAGIALNPRSGDGHRIKGCLLERLAEHEKSIAEFGAAIRLNSEDARAFAGRGAVLGLLGRCDEAMADLNEAIRIDPDDPMAHVCRGAARMVKQDVPGALEDLNDAVRLDRTCLPAYLQRAEVLFGMGGIDAALADFNEAIKIRPDSPDAYYARALALYRAGRFEPAIKDFDEVIRRRPDWAIAYNDRGAAWWSLRDSNRAIADVTEAIKRNPNSGQFYGNRGLYYFIEGKHAEAAADYAVAVKVDPNWQEALVKYSSFLATCPEAKYRDGSKAIEMAMKACELSGWSNPHYVRVLAAAQAEVGNFEEAIRRQEQALKLWAQAGVEVPKDETERLTLYRDGRPYRYHAPADAKVSRASSGGPEPR